MIRIFILFFLLNSSLAYGYSYFNYDKNKVKVSSRSFHNYIRPQIRNIVHDFYSVLKKINPLQEDVINLKNQISRFNLLWKDFSPYCTEEKCIENFEDIKSLAKKINIRTLRLDEDLTDLFSNKKNIDSTIILSQHSGKISDLWHNISNYLEGPFLYKDKRQMGIYLEQVTINMNIMLTKPLDDDIQKNFYFVWSNFIKKLEQEVIEKQNMKFLITRLEELNITWNSFYMKVPRWKDMPKKQLKIMHQRWNSILKIVLVR